MRSHSDGVEAEPLRRAAGGEERKQGKWKQRLREMKALEGDSDSSIVIRVGYSSSLLAIFESFSLSFGDSGWVV